MGSIRRDTIVEYLDQKLNISGIADSSVNGVQIEGADLVDHLAVSVDSGLSVIERAVEIRAQLLIVHHGLFWGGSLPVRGPVKRLFRAAIVNELTVYAAHLPLDWHPDLGNNFCLARMLGLTAPRHAIPHQGTNIGCVAENGAGSSLEELEQRLGTLPGARLPLLTLPFGPKVPKSVCVVTGSGSDALWGFAKEGFDTLITGEPRQSVYHYARENGLNVIFGGHYATETIGVMETARALEKEFGLRWSFIDEPTGI